MGKAKTHQNATKLFKNENLPFIVVTTNPVKHASSKPFQKHWA